MASWVLDINCVRISFQKCAGISCYHTNHGGIFFYVSAMELAQVAMVLGRCNSFFSNRYTVASLPAFYLRPYILAVIHRFSVKAFAANHRRATSWLLVLCKNSLVGPAMD